MKLLPLSFALVVVLAACAKPADTSPATDTAPAATAEAAPAATVAQAPAANDADPTADYTLTMENVDAWLTATKHLADAEKTDPSLDSAMNASSEDGLQYAARLEGTPALRDAIAKAGISTRDYALTGELLIAAMMAQGALEAGQLKEIPEGLNPQSVEFVKTHKAEIEAKMKAMGDA